jgi:hypothetical protein
LVGWVLLGLVVGMINLNASKEDMDKIVLIVERSIDLVASLNGPKIEFSDGLLDLVACHLNGSPLRLEDMAIGDDLDLLHDFMGIRRHIDRETGKLIGDFTPRFSA